MLAILVSVGEAPAVVGRGDAPLTHPDGSPEPSFLTRAGRLVYFGIDDELDGGWQLWRTDGTAGGTVLLARDLGRDMEIAAFARRVAVAARGALWVSDGSPAGTRRATTLTFFPTGMKTVDGLLVFGDGNGQLWRSDGTAAGTWMITHVPPFHPVHDVTPAGITRGDGCFFFRAIDGDIGSELWVSDGSAEGTRPVVDLGADGGSFPGYFRFVDGSLFFSADGGAGFEPWVTDGTAAGTRSLGDLNPLGSSDARHFRDAGGVVFFVADAGGGDGPELWRTDGTATSTRRVTEINPDGGAFPNALVAMGGVLYFRADDGRHGSELWRSDGTPGGTRMVADVNPTGSSYPRGLLPIGRELVFVADDGTTGEELWRTDGTAAGTVRLLDLHSAGSSSPSWLRVLDGRLLFSASAGDGRRLYAADGCLGGTPVPCRASVVPLPDVRRADRGTPYLVRDIRPGPGGSDPYALTALGRVLLFRATDDAHGTELWRSDGTALGTELVVDIRAGRDGSLPYELTAAGDVAYFQADDGRHGTELWVTDGTAAGTRLVADVNPGGWGSWPEEITPFGDRVLFLAGGHELWVSDGTVAGTRQVRSLERSFRDPRELVAIGDVVYFSASDGFHGRRLWRSDATDAGTRPVGSAARVPRLLTAVGSRLFFTGPVDYRAPPVLWASDGTPEGTMPVSDLAQPEELVASGERLFFTARDAYGRELRVLDAVGPPRLVRDIHPAGDGTPRRLTDVDGTVFFYASDGQSGWELWASDGTSGGTRLVVDADPTNVTQPSFLTKVGSRLFFSAHTPSFGRELWVSDGTPAGSGLVRNIHPARSSYPESFVDVSGTLFFYADDGSSGAELWALTACGDGIVNPGEECDDGNLDVGDGCSRRCRLEMLPPGACSDRRRCVAGARLAAVDGRRLHLAFKARDEAIVLPDPAGAADDPREHGMVVLVRSAVTGQSLVLPLPAERWRVVRRRGRSSYRYRGGTGAACRTAVLRAGVLRLRCRSDDPSLQIGVPGEQRLEIRMVLGDARSYCLAFAGRPVPGRRGRTRLKVRDSARPSVCR